MAGVGGRWLLFILVRLAGGIAQHNNTCSEPPCRICSCVAMDQDKDDGIAGDLLIKRKDSVSIVAADDYKDRVNITENYSLLIAEGSLSDQKTFTCMVVTELDVLTYPINVLVQSEYRSP